MLKDADGTWLTTSEAAERLGLSLPRVRGLRLAGELGPVRLIGREPLLLQSHVDSYVRKPPGYPAGRPRRKPEE